MLLLSVCLLAILSLGATQEECSTLQQSELEGMGGLISGVLFAGEADPGNVAVNDFTIVCLASSSVRDRYRFVSVVVDYSCVGIPSCMGTTQFDFQCDSGSWIATIFGDVANTQGTPATGTLSTMLQRNCSFCFGPSVAEANPFSILQPGTTADDETHCVPCDSSCIGPEDNGLGLCTGNQAGQCCNVFVNNTCMVECPTGFELLNRECVVSCGPLPNITNGRVVLTTTFVNSTATYECVTPGFNLSENVTRTCLNSGMWSMDEPTCDIVDCGNLDPPDNGDVSHPTTTFSSRATYSCDPGFELDGNEQRTCQATGMWDGSDPTCDDLCEGVNCVNGNCTAGSCVCLPGYTGTLCDDDLCEGVNCVNGNCSTGSCVCLPGYTGTLCEMNMDLCNNVSCVNGVCSEGICTCNAGFTGSPCVCECTSAGRCTTNGSMCVCNESYSGPPFCNTCACQSAGRCTTDSAPDFECMCTAMYFGPPSCSGLCSVAIPRCISCEGDDDPVCSECQEGYEVVDGRCRIVDCGVLQAPENGNINLPNTTFGSIATYSCEPGFEIMGSMQRICQANGMWNGSDPTCEEEGLTSVPQSGGGGGCDGACIGAIIGSLLGVLLLAAIIAAIVFAIYKYYTNPATQVKKQDTQGLNGVARDNPLYVDPTTVEEEVGGVGEAGEAAEATGEA